MKNQKNGGVALKTRRKTAKAALLCLFCALLMAALPVTALAEMELCWSTQNVSISVDGTGITFSDTQPEFTIMVKGTGENSVVTPGEATVYITNEA
ncbi:MAG: hypothetical protein IJ982_02525, partial [Fibrobacter sp.]|nr:hypothetical protein [Fibrobacter sp.]